MKTKLSIFAVLSALILTGCSKEKDLYQGTQSSVSQEEIDQNVERVFGTTFDPSHDWNATKSGSVNISVNSDKIEKVLLMAFTEEVNEEGERVTSLSVLNEADVNGQSSIQLYYDAPSSNLGLYVAFLSSNSYTLKRVVDNTVASNSRPMTRAISTAFTLPDTELRITNTVESFASKRNWLPGEVFYEMSDYASQKMAVDDYDDDYKQIFRTLVFSYFKNGRQYNNLPLVKNSGLYNENVYPVTTGDEPIILSPVYKRDGGSVYGDEVKNSDLYYYYFREEDLGDDPVAYIESLPKYKAIPFMDCCKDDDVISKHAAYALIYWGDGIPNEETVGSYQFPRGYKVGFMIQSKTTVEGGKKQGELWGDGRLNRFINTYDKCNFKSSKLGSSDPRMAWLTVNDKMLLCCESGTDTDFNDVIIEVEGGVEGFTVIPDTEKATYTYCFEDTQLGDYDLNDVVIKATRVGNKVTYSVVACGAQDELYIKNINAGNIKDNTEVHALFGKQQSEFINTDPGREKCEPVSATKNVSGNFSFLDEANQPYIYNKTRDRNIYLSKAGQDPHGIMIPNDFKYPTERTCVKDAYTEFNSWGKNPINATTWYTEPIYEKVYNK